MADCNEARAAHRSSECTSRKALMPLGPTPSSSSSAHCLASSSSASVSCVLAAPLPPAPRAPVSWPGSVIMEPSWERTGSGRGGDDERFCARTSDAAARVAASSVLSSSALPSRLTPGCSSRVPGRGGEDALTVSCPRVSGRGGETYSYTHTFICTYISHTYKLYTIYVTTYMFHLPDDTGYSSKIHDTYMHDK